jgi:hypothetical protein
VAKAQIVLPRVAPYFKDEDAGIRVDRVLTQLTSDLKNLKAADTASVAGVPAASVGSSGIFFQTFENPVETTWLRRTDPTTLSYTANGQAGGKALNAVGEIFFEFPENVPFADDRLYRIRAKFRMTSAPADPAKDLVSVGVQGYAADGTTLVDTSGGTTATLAHWYAAADVDMGGLTLNQWYTYTGYFSGWGAASTTPSTDADAPRLMDSDVRYIRPCFRLNHAAGDGTMELDYISLEVLTEGTEGNQLMKDAVNLSTGKIATNKVVEGSITAGSISTNKLDAQAVTAAKIATGTITATQITGSALSAIYADLGTITAGYIKNSGNTAAIRVSGSATLPSTNYIDFTATGNNPWLKTTALELQADGDATFSGTVSGDSFTGTNAIFSGSVKTNTGGGSAFTSISGSAVTCTNLIAGEDIQMRLGGTVGEIRITNGGSTTQVIDFDRTKIGFLNTAAVSKQTVTGSRGGNAALASVLTALANFGLITDSST